MAAVAAVAAATAVVAPGPANAAPPRASTQVAAAPVAAAWPYTCAPTLKAVVTLLPPSVVISGTGFVPGDTVYIYIQKGPIKILLVKVVANVFGAILTGNLIAAILLVALRGEVNILGIDVTAGICLNVQAAVQLTITGLGTVLLSHKQAIDGLPAASGPARASRAASISGSSSSWFTTSGVGFFGIAALAVALLVAGSFILARRRRT